MAIKVGINGFGRIGRVALRIMVDLTARLIHPATYHDVCVAMENAARNSMKGIITCTRDQVVSSDLTGDLTARLIHPATYHDVCVAMENAARNSMKGIITCTRDQVVSSDLTGFSYILQELFRALVSSLRSGRYTLLVHKGATSFGSMRKEGKS